MPENTFSEDELKEMIDQCKRTLAADPNQVEKLLMLARLFHIAGRSEESLEQFSKALTVNPNAIDAFRLRASVYWDCSELEKALADCDKVLELEGWVADDYITRGLVKERMEDFRGALDDYSNAIAENPELAEGYRCRGNLLGRKGEYKQALVDFNRLISLDGAFENYLSRGAVWECLDDFESARKDYSLAIEKDPLLAQPYKIRANLFFQQGRFEQALSDIERVIELEGNAAENYLLRGTIKEQLNDEQGAFDDFSKAVSIDATLASAYKRRGRLQAQQERYEPALDDFNKAIAIDPDDIESFLALGLIKECINDLEGALDKYTKAISLRPELAEPYRRRGRLSLVRGKLDDALEDFDKIVSLDDAADDYVTRGYIKECIGNREDAFDDYSLAISKDERCTRAWKLRGLLLAGQDQFEQALDDFNHLLQLGDDGAETFLIRGMAQECLSNFTQSLDDYSTAISKEPRLVEAYRYRARLSCRLNLDLDRALEDLNKVVSLEEGGVDNYIERAALREQLGDIEGALDDYTAALESGPNCEAYISRGSLLAQKEEFERAKADFDRAVEVDPNHIGAHLNRYFVNRQLSAYDLALVDAGRLIELRPDIDGFQVYKGEALAFLGRFGEAVELCEQYVAEGKERTAPFLMLLALTQYLSGQYAKSGATFFAAQLEFGKNEPGNAINALVFSILANRKAGMTISASVMQKADELRDLTIWPAPVIRFLLNELSYEELLELASSQAEKTDVHTASGIIRSIAGDLKGAAEHLAWSKENGVCCYEKLLAIHELKSLAIGV